MRLEELADEPVEVVRSLGRREMSHAFKLDESAAADAVGQLATVRGGRLLVERAHDDVLEALVGFGSTSEHLTKNQDRLLDIRVQLEGLRSSIQDVDFSDAILRMAQAENALQLEQATGVRLLQNSLLNFIR